MRNVIFTLLLSFCLLKAEEPQIMTLDSFADVYYDAETGNPTVSDEIKKLHGQTVRIAGYMVPFNSLENLKEFMLMPSSNGCNFCESPMKEEIIYVRQSGNKKFDFINEPLVITGKLWINGAGTEAKNKTFAQFLYAFEDAKVEKLEKKHHAILDTVTPRTIIKQVCSLLKVRLLKQVRFQELNEADYTNKRKETLLQYLGGESRAQELENFLTIMEVPGGSDLVNTSTEYLANWSSAFSDTTGDVIYYREELDLSKPEGQRQIAIACYDVLFHHEVQMGEQIHQGDPTYEELITRLSLILGLRQSFTQFYGSIGLIDMLPLANFAKPHREGSTLEAPYQEIANQLLINNQDFVTALYASEHYQPYTKAIMAPPSSMKQIFTPKLYTEGKPYNQKSLLGFQDQFGSYLTSLILQCAESDLITDGINFDKPGFTWKVQFNDATSAKKSYKSLLENSKLRATLEKNFITITLQ